jgi:hypothetical protein
MPGVARTWTWASLMPGTIVLPPALMTFVFLGWARARTWWFDPTAITFPPLIAMAFAQGVPGSAVKTFAS